MKFALILGIILAISLKDAAAKEPKDGKSFFKALSLFRQSSGSSQAVNPESSRLVNYCATYESF